MHGGFDGGFDGCVLVLHGEDHDTAAPTPVHLQLEPVVAGCEPVNADGKK